MKKLTNLKRLMLVAGVTSTMLTGLISFQAMAQGNDDPVPAPGCRFTGIESDYCVVVIGGGLWGVTSCSNNSGGSDCGYITPPGPTGG
ncbi:hypothetical protein [Pedobacter miscanthi]|uniref:hypothetical protein n=1 Tax=Pedobacter miscanthi TaxID=2259170 RepID=UPI00292F766A|nr:hypothetical protein [Pedobacter miscanthi]